MTRLGFVRLVPCVAAMLMMGTSGTSAQESRQLHVTLPATYENDSTQAAKLLQVARLLPPRVEHLEPGGTVSRLIVDTFGFGPSDLPDFYRILERDVLTRNGLVDGTDAVPGPVLLPRLPRWATVGTEYRDTVPMLVDVQPELFRRASIQRAVGFDSLVVAGEVILAASPQWRRTAPQVEYGVRTQVEQQQLEAVLDLLSEVGARVSSEGPFDLFFDSAVAGPLPAAPAPTAEEHDAIVSAIGRVRRSATLYVLDTGWPDQAARDSSIARIVDLVNVVRRVRGFPGSVAPPVRYEPHDPFTAPANRHVIDVQEALRPFVDMDGGRIVRVVYVPMTREQGADSVLVHLVHTYLMLRHSRFVGSIRTTPDDADSLRAIAARNVAVLQDGASREYEVFRSAHEILNAVWTVAEYAAEHAGRYYMISTSWLVSGKGILLPAVPGNPAGLLVAGTGNRRERVIDDRIDLAMRARTRAEFLAVMNMPENSVACRSGTMETTPLRHAAVVGYDGRLADGRCATSYATPRVAWLLSLDQAMERSDPAHSTWSLSIHERLLGMRDPRRGLDGVRLDVVRLFAGR